MWAIVIRSGITLEQLLELNGLRETDLIQPGQKLIIGYGAPPMTATSDATPTPTATLPPPTPLPATPTPLLTAVCLSAFQDTNSNGLQESGEPLQTAVAFTIYTQEAVAANYVTDGVSEPHCLPLPPGSYQITRSLAPAETLTSRGDQAVVLTVGDVMYLAFGSKTDATAVPLLPSPSSLPTFTAAGTAVTNTATTPADGQPGSAGSLFPLVVLIMGGLLLTVVAIYFVRTRLRGQ